MMRLKTRHALGGKLEGLALGHAASGAVVRK